MYTSSLLITGIRFAVAHTKRNFKRERDRCKNAKQSFAQTREKIAPRLFRERGPKKISQIKTLFCTFS